MKYIQISLAVLLTAGLTACGYTAKTTLPDHVQTVYVQPVRNAIDITKPTRSGQPFQTYRPGLEVELRNALIDRVVFDGHFKIEDENDADAILEAELIGFDREPVRYNADDSIQEFRVHVSAKIRFTDVTDNKVLWSSDHVSGDASYFLSGSRAISEDQAVEEALDDLVRRVLESILEVW